MKRPLKHSAGAIAPLLLFAVFTVCILSVLLTGADVLKTISKRDQESFRQRTCAQYLTTRIRQSDLSPQPWVGDFSQSPETDTDVLVQETSILSGDTLFLL